jgi:hypothetical protein
MAPHGCGLLLLNEVWAFPLRGIGRFSIVGRAQKLRTRISTSSDSMLVKWDYWLANRNHNIPNALDVQLATTLSTVTNITVWAHFPEQLFFYRRKSLALPAFIC